MGSYTRLHIRVNYNGPFGESVGVGGSSVAFGQFQSSDAVPLVTTPTHYPIWCTLNPIVVPTSVPISYKYCISTGGKFSRWEQIDTEVPTTTAWLWQQQHGSQTTVGGDCDYCELLCDSLCDCGSCFARFFCLFCVFLLQILLLQFLMDLCFCIVSICWRCWF